MTFDLVFLALALAAVLSLMFVILGLLEPLMQRLLQKFGIGEDEDTVCSKCDKPVSSSMIAAFKDGKPICMKCFYDDGAVPGVHDLEEDVD